MASDNFLDLIAGEVGRDDLAVLHGTKFALRNSFSTDEKVQAELDKVMTVKKSAGTAERLLLILGAGGHAANILEVAAALGRKVGGFIDETGNSEQHHPFFNLPVFANTVEATAKIPPSDLFVGIGESWGRAKATERIMDAGLEGHLVSLAHPAASVSSTAIIGKGSLIMPGAYIGPRAVIGDGALIGANASVGHDCVLGDYVSLFSGVSIGGGARIGDRSAIGMNAAIREQTFLGRDVVVGSLSFVRNDFDDRCVVLGVPGRAVRTRAVDESYLG